MRELKTWGGTIRDIHYGNIHHQARIVVKAYTIKQAIELAKITYFEFKEHFSITRNDRECSLPFEVGLWIYDERLNSSYHDSCPIVRLT